MRRKGRGRGEKRRAERIEFSLFWLLSLIVWIWIWSDLLLSSVLCVYFVPFLQIPRTWTIPIPIHINWTILRRIIYNETRTESVAFTLCWLVSTVHTVLYVHESYLLTYSSKKMRGWLAKLSTWGSRAEQSIAQQIQAERIGVEVENEEKENVVYL